MNKAKFEIPKAVPSEIHNTFNKEALVKYLFWVFAIAWALQFVAIDFYKSGNGSMFATMLAISMFVPLISCKLAGMPLKGMGFKPDLRNNLSNVLLSMWGPTVLFALGAAIYFLIFRNQFTTGGDILMEQIDEETKAQLVEKGVGVYTLILAQILQIIVYAPFANMFVAIGEEAGWRGFMYPQLKAYYGVNKGRIIGGLIWGIWHFPVIIFAGYEYGTEYIGAPVLGPAVFLIFAVIYGIILDFLYERARFGIWFPALMHGAINAGAAIGMLFQKTEFSLKYRIFGPGGNGLIVMIPSILFALEICRMEKKRAAKNK